MPTSISSNKLAINRDKHHYHHYYQYIIIIISLLSSYYYHFYKYDYYHYNYHNHYQSNRLKSLQLFQRCSLINTRCFSTISLSHHRTKRWNNHLILFLSWLYSPYNSLLMSSYFSQLFMIFTILKRNNRKSIMQTPGFLTKGYFSPWFMDLTFLKESF